MKYIKHFEKLDDDYKVGDVVRVILYGITSDETRDFVNSNPGVIININIPETDYYPYVIDFIDKLPNKPNSTYVFTKSEIERRATPEEIELLNIKIELKKYNI